MISAIIHQIWIQGYENMSIELKQYQYACQMTNSHFYYMFWNEGKIRQFLFLNYDQKYLALYDSYTVLAQKSYFARYAILYIYGGIYVNMDMVCRKSLKQFIGLSFFLTIDSFYKLNRQYLCSILGSKPKHPLFLIIFNNIFIRQSFSYDIAYATGCRLLCDSIEEYTKIYNNDITVIDPSYIQSASYKDPKYLQPSRYKDRFVPDTSTTWFFIGLFVLGAIFILFLLCTLFSAY
jgi:inositol phosphorylceramide mannosyltransferase catalytic subunit